MTLSRPLQCQDWRGSRGEEDDRASWCASTAGRCIKEIFDHDDYHSWKTIDNWEGHLKSQAYSTNTAQSASSPCIKQDLNPSCIREDLSCQIIVDLTKTSENTLVCATFGHLYAIQFKWPSEWLCCLTFSYGSQQKIQANNTLVPVLNLHIPINLVTWCSWWWFQRKLGKYPRRQHNWRWWQRWRRSYIRCGAADPEAGTPCYSPPPPGGTSCCCSY